jgi:stage III sporulation protein AG
MIFLKNLLKNVIPGDSKNKRKIENIVFLIIILIITVILMKTIWQDDSPENKLESTNSTEKSTLAESQNTEKEDLEKRMESILSTIKNVGKVNVLINYSESSKMEALYNESTTTSSTEEGDTSGGTRNVTETETKKDVVFSEKSGNKEPVTQKTVMPTIQGAVITAEGAGDPIVKTNIINAVGALTGLSIDKIQVFEIQS